MHLGGDGHLCIWKEMTTYASRRKWHVGGDGSVYHLMIKVDLHVLSIIRFCLDSYIYIYIYISPYLSTA